MHLFVKVWPTFWYPLDLKCKLVLTWKWLNNRLLKWTAIQVSQIEIDQYLLRELDNCHFFDKFKLFFQPSLLTVLTTLFNPHCINSISIHHLLLLFTKCIGLSLIGHNNVLVHHRVEILVDAHPLPRFWQIHTYTFLIFSTTFWQFGVLDPPHFWQQISSTVGPLTPHPQPL